MKLLGISGSLRKESYNTQLLREVSELIEGEFEILDISRLPLYNEDLDTVPAFPAVREFREKLRQANAVLLAVPEYNGSLPGGLKNALDWASRPFPDNALKGKVVTVIGASTGVFGAVWAQAETRKVLKTLGARVIGEEDIPMGMVSARDPLLQDDEVTEKIKQRVNELQSVLTPV